MKVVKKNFNIRIYLSKVDKNDKGDKIVSGEVIDSIWLMSGLFGTNYWISSTISQIYYYNKVTKSI